MSSTERTQAIILRRTNYGEADRILKMITPLGQRSVMARGVRREKSKLAGGIELFGISDIVIQQGKSDLGVLTSSSLIHFYRHILEDYDRLQFGYESINLVTRASEMIDEPEWFDVLAEVYKGLDNFSVPLQLVQTWFYVQYAALTGYELNLSRDVTGRLLSADKTYMYDPVERGLRLSEQGDVTAEHIKYLRIISVKDLATILQVGGAEYLLPDVWLIARQQAAV